MRRTRWTPVNESNCSALMKPLLDRGIARVASSRAVSLNEMVLDKPMHILEPNPRPLRHAALLSALAMSRSMISKRSIINALAISSPYAPINSI